VTVALEFANEFTLPVNVALAIHNVALGHRQVSFSSTRSMRHSIRFEKCAGAPRGGKSAPAERAQRGIAHLGHSRQRVRTTGCVANL
jgi:hypothetical protein